MFVGNLTTCPNTQCREVSFIMTMNQVHSTTVGDYPGEIVKKWTLMPSSVVRVFPSYVPPAIVDDYNEACLIKELSPKASATLSRRCLQGIIRDFWNVNKKTLYDEIEAIKDRVDPLAWRAIDAVRKIGNIGAHMEKDINIIIDVEPNEAQLLITLIETLINEWYVARHEREKRMNEIINLAAVKEDIKKGN
jgi:hypothetical protein